MAYYTRRWQNLCQACGYHWYPRGHNVSRACPSCGSSLVVIPTSKKRASGCLVVVTAVAAAIMLSNLFNAVGAAGGFLILIGLPALFFGGRAYLRHLREQDDLRVRQIETVADQRRLEQRQEALRLEAAHQAEERQRARDERHARLVARFGEDGARFIEARKLWVGAPEEAAVEVYGSPDDVEEKVLKTKSKRILKYRDPVHATRISVRVTVENGEVIGWEDKG
jgi:predicted RNA-binding Zn-ribbon protein involved in translation (DUF1610 family)